MDLPKMVEAELGVSESRAVQGVGALFVAIRMVTDPRSFTVLAGAFPDAGEWMQHAPFQSGGTGEMLAMVTEGAVRRVLLVAGFTDAELPRLGAIVGGAVAVYLSERAAQQLWERLPLLRPK